jgi:hypothetical protein
MMLSIPIPANKVQTKVHFSLANKRLLSNYISSIPQSLNLLSVHEYKKPTVRGMSNGFLFYETSFSYISARCNLNDSNVDEALFLLRIETMFSTLQYLNRQPIRSLDVILILRHIKEYSNYVFNVREVYLIARRFQYNSSLVKTKSRDYAIKKYTVYKKKIDFLNALNNARRVVNSNFNLNELFYLLEERITNDDYGYLNEASIIGHKDNNLLIYAMVRKFNLLCTGLQRQGQKQAKSEALYCNSIKSLTLKSKLLKPQKKVDFMQKAIVKCKPKLTAIKHLVNNRSVAQQMFQILADLTGIDFNFEITPDEEVQNQVKAALINLINKKASVDMMAEALEFDRIYKKAVKKSILPPTNISNIFDTDMTNSIFNQMSVEDAMCEGFSFYVDYVVFKQNQKNAA